MTAERGHSVLMKSNTVAERVEGLYRVTGGEDLRHRVGRAHAVHEHGSAR